MSTPLVVEMPQDEFKASSQIKTFIKKINRLQSIKENMLTNITTSSVDTLLDAIDTTNNNSITFDNVQSLITSPAFVEAMSDFLHLLPKDPNVLLSAEEGDIDKGLLALPVRLVSSCVVIALFPDAVLVPSSPKGVLHQQDSADIGSDETSEASQTYLSARFMLKALHRFLKYIKIMLKRESNENNSKITSLSTFKQILLNYRFVSRTFIASLDRWKKMDNLRFVSSLEVSYCQCYAIVVQCRRSHVNSTDEQEKTANEKMAAGAELQIIKISALLRQFLKENSACRLEELQAQVEGHFDQGRNRAVSDLLTMSVPAETSARIAEGVSANRGAVQGSEATLQREKEAEIAMKRLTEIIGIENEKIAFEIMSDSKFKLADAPSPESVMLPLGIDGKAYLAMCKDMKGGALSIARRMKMNMLFVLRDRLVWSLMKCPVSNKSELHAGVVVPVKVGSDTYLSCEIVGVERDEDTDEVMSVDVVYFVDGTPEKVTDLSRIRMTGEVVDHLPLLLALEDLRGRLLALSPKGASGVQRLQIDMALLRDLLLEQSQSSMNEANAIIIDAFAGMFGFLRDLQSPARADEMLLWWEKYYRMIKETNNSHFATLVPSFFEYMTASIDQLNRDLANYYISTVAPVLNKHGPAFMLSRFITKLSDGPPTNTINMLNNILQTQNDKFSDFKGEVNEAFGYPLFGDTDIDMRGALAEGAAPDKAALLHRATIAKMLINILQKPFRLNTAENHHLLPETLHVYEADKLAAVRDYVDIISLELSIIIATKQILATPCPAAGFKGGLLLSEEEEISLARRLDVLLRESDIEVKMLATEVACTVSKCCGGRGREPRAPVSAAFADEILRTMRGTVSDKNPVLAIFAKRLYKVVFRAMMDLPYAGCLASFSLHSPAQADNIKKVCFLAQKVFALHFSIYRPVYGDVLGSQAFLEETSRRSDN